MKSEIGGFKGRKLQAGDYMNFRIKRRYLPFFLSRKLEPENFDQDKAEVRVVMGPQDEDVYKRQVEAYLKGELISTGSICHEHEHAHECGE